MRIPSFSALNRTLTTQASSEYERAVHKYGKWAGYNDTAAAVDAAEKKVDEHRAQLSQQLQAQQNVLAQRPALASMRRETASTLNRLQQMQKVNISAIPVVSISSRVLAMRAPTAGGLIRAAA